MSENDSVYNSSDWKTLSFTYVEYPRSKFIQTHHHKFYADSMNMKNNK